MCALHVQLQPAYTVPSSVVARCRRQIPAELIGRLAHVAGCTTIESLLQLFLRISRLIRRVLAVSVRDITGRPVFISTGNLPTTDFLRLCVCVYENVHTVDLPNDITLGAAYDGGRVLPMVT